MKANCDVIGVIPARYASTRLPYKLVRNILGKPLIQWTWENASRASMLDRLIIACDDPRIEEAAKEFGAETILTSSNHGCGTDRIAEVVRDIDVKVIINIQGDEPLVHPTIIDALASEMLNDTGLVMSTVKKKMEDEEEISNPAVVKVVCTKDDYALYFSRLPIPYYRERGGIRVYHKHLGIYAYAKDFLYTFKNLPVSFLEKSEKLEQLRALEAGYKIKVLQTQFDSVGVDTEEDFYKVEEILREKVRSN